MHKRDRHNGQLFFDHRVVQEIDEKVVDLRVPVGAVDMRRDKSHVYGDHFVTLRTAVRHEAVSNVREQSQDHADLRVSHSGVYAGAVRVDHAGVHGRPLFVRVSAVFRTRVLYA